MISIDLHDPDRLSIRRNTGPNWDVVTVIVHSGSSSIALYMKEAVFLKLCSSLQNAEAMGVHQSTISTRYPLELCQESTS